MPKHVPHIPELAPSVALLDMAAKLSGQQPEAAFLLAGLAYQEAQRTSDEAAQWAALAQQIPLAGLLGMHAWLAEHADEVVRLGQQFAPMRELRRIHGILGMIFLRLGRMAQSAEQHRKACVLAQQLGTAELAYALYNSSIGFNEFHRPERMLNLGQEILALDLSEVPHSERQKVSSYGYLACAAASAHLADQALLQGHVTEVWSHASRGLAALHQSLALPPITDNAAFEQRTLYVHVCLLNLMEPVPEQLGRLRKALEAWGAWTNAHALESNPRNQLRWLCALGWEAGLRQDSAGVDSYFRQARVLIETLPFEATLWLRLHSQYSRAARQVGDLQTALLQQEAYSQHLFARLQHEDRRTLEEMSARFELAEAQHISQTAQMRAATLRQLVQQREHALHDEQLYTLERLAMVAEYRDNDSKNHINWVADAAACVAEQLGQGPEFVQRLQMAARLHDIGKIALPDAVLFKPGGLTPAEFEIVKTHTVLGADILEAPQHPFLPLAAMVARTHHERWDGSGYPAGLRAEAIPLVGRIVSVVDVYDALRAARPYKEAWTEDAALTYLKAGASTQFDPQIVDAFLDAHAAGRLPERKSTGSGVQPQA
ncbi:HD-GYP domain-containing protein [Deinococcus oregonensis]|uniref:HD-GYP domain-containing protein n=1 Tax=Deinococcus oregonensis TaxID=1805970 RepID=A0ABV6B666_9DEIO